MDNAGGLHGYTRKRDKNDQNSDVCQYYLPLSCGDKGKGEKLVDLVCGIVWVFLIA